MYEVTIKTGDMHAYRFVFNFFKDASDFISKAMTYTCDDLEVTIVRREYNKDVPTTTVYDARTGERKEHNL